MYKSSGAVALLCCFAITASCEPAPQTPQIVKFCPPSVNLQPLSCGVTNNYLVAVGNPNRFAIPKGTPISFEAKLVNAGAYCTTVPAPEPIPAHLAIDIRGQPLFDNQAPCQAWQEVPPVFTQ